MSNYLTSLFELFFLPPGVFLWLLVLSVLLSKNLQTLKRLLILQILLLYLLTIPVTSHYLFSLLESIPALTEEQIQDNKADVIVVLAGGIKPYKKEYHGPDIGYFTQLRLRYAAWLQKKTNLPILVTGGIEKQGYTEAALMKQVLQNEYAISGRIFVEQESQNTFENSFYSRKILVSQQFKRFYLLTSAFHMPRALSVFSIHNEGVIPAPMGFYHNSMDFLPGDFMPNSKSLWQNYLALHEIIGFYWYKLRYFNQ
ncbi:MAG: YdcF family protein [Gammaproteobacteria bacterium]|nr:YdcF family protein [Gammaproteobacteria bacterium]